MAILTKKVVIVALAIFVMLSIALRYPLVEHERYQADSYFIHMLSGSIVSNGYAKWTFHPLSYFGYYPYSYPSGTPFLVAEFSELSGTTVEVSILLMGMLLSIVFCLSAFVLARQFLRNPEYVLLATLLTILGSRFIDTTYWDGSARGPGALLFILVVAVSFRATASGQTRFYLMSIFLAIGCFVVHHMGVLLLLVGLAYVISAFESQYIVRRATSQRRRLLVAFNIVIAGVFVGIPFGYFAFFGDLALLNLQETSLFDIEPPALSVLLNAAASYTNQIGFILLFALLGIPGIFRSQRFSIEMIFPLTIVLVFIPLIGNALYISMLLSPFVAILGTAWIRRVWHKSKHKRSVVFVVILLIASSVALPVWSTNRWNAREYASGDTVAVDSQFTNDANYLTIMEPGVNAISNGVIMDLHMAALSDVVFFESGIPLALSGDITKEDMHENVTWSKVPFPRNLYMWFSYVQEPNVDIYVLGLMVIGAEFLAQGGGMGFEAKDFFADHSRILVVIDNKWPSVYIGKWNTLSAVFPSQLQNATWSTSNGTSRDYYELQSYVMYETERISVYMVELPI